MSKSEQEAFSKALVKTGKPDGDAIDAVGQTSDLVKALEKDNSQSSKNVQGYLQECQYLSTQTTTSQLHDEYNPSGKVKVQRYNSKSDYHYESSFAPSPSGNSNTGTQFITPGSSTFFTNEPMLTKKNAAQQLKLNKNDTLLTGLVKMIANQIRLQVLEDIELSSNPKRQITLDRLQEICSGLNISIDGELVKDTAELQNYLVNYVVNALQHEVTGMVVVITDKKPWELEEIESRANDLDQKGARPFPNQFDNITMNSKAMSNNIEFSLDAPGMDNINKAL